MAHIIMKKIKGDDTSTEAMCGSRWCLYVHEYGGISETQLGAG